MKRIVSLVLICMLSAGCLSTSAVVFTKDNVSVQKNYKNMPYGNYLRYYNIDDSRIFITFKQLSEEEDKNFEKTLTKEEKQDYKYVKKVQKLIDKGNWNEIFYKHSDFFPAYIQYYNLCITRKNWHEALRILSKIKSVDPYNRVFDSDIMDFAQGELYLQAKQYQNALEYFKTFEGTGKDSVYAYIAMCYFNLGDYNSAITYMKKIKNLSYDNKELMYSIYIENQNYKEAHKWALELLNSRYSYENFMKAQATSQNEEEKLQYLYQARNSSINESEITVVNKMIVDIEQKKLEKRISSLNQFVKVPCWTDFKNDLPQNISVTELSNKQDEFYKTANDYLARYTGQNLTNAFNSLNQDYVNYVQNKKNEYYQEQQLLQQQAMQEAQQQMMYIQQVQAQQHQLEHYRRMQRIYYLTRPYDDFSMPPWP